MESILIDDREIELKPQDVESFKEFTRMAYPQLPRLMEQPRERRFIGQLPAGYILARLKAGDDFNTNLMQVALWNLHDLGVRELQLDREKGAANVKKSVKTDCAEGKPEWYTQANVVTGRGYIAAMNNMIHRIFRLNAQEIEVGLQPEDQVKATMERVIAAKDGEEGLIFTATRDMVQRINDKQPVNDPEMRCLIEVLSGMGLVALGVDSRKGSVMFHGFSIMSALSTALLQGVEWNQLQEIKKQIKNLAEQSQPKLAMPSMPGHADVTPARRRRRD